MLQQKASSLLRATTSPGSEEAQTLSDRSLALLRPTIRAVASLWDIGGAGAKADAMALDCAMSGAGNWRTTTTRSHSVLSRQKPKPPLQLGKAVGSPELRLNLLLSG
jgi:hypothetical protein